jgi:hypothetical protein
MSRAAPYRVAGNGPFPATSRSPDAIGDRDAATDDQGDTFAAVSAARSVDQDALDTPQETAVDRLPNPRPAAAFDSASRCGSLLQSRRPREQSRSYCRSGTGAGALLWRSRRGLRQARLGSDLYARPFPPLPLGEPDRLLAGPGFGLTNSVIAGPTETATGEGPPGVALGRTFYFLDPPLLDYPGGNRPPIVEGRAVLYRASPNESAAIALQRAAGNTTR